VTRRYKPGTLRTRALILRDAWPRRRPGALVAAALGLSTLVAVPSCLGDADDGADQSIAGAGGSVASGGTGSAATGGMAGGEAATGGLGGAYPKDAFVVVWDTCHGDCGDMVGNTAWRTVELPLVSEGIYDFVVDWGDGTTSKITSSGDEDRTHTYGETTDPEDERAIVIRGVIEGWQFPSTLVVDDHVDEGWGGSVALLIGWAEQPTHDDVVLGAQGFQSSAAAASARAVLVDDRGWTISDGGPFPSAGGAPP
jgi:hypothetical protein